MPISLNIHSNITFIVKQDTKPVYDSSAITGMIPKLYFKTEKKKVFIEDARKLNNCAIDKNGFQFHKFESKYDEENISKNIKGYKREIELFLKKEFYYKHIFIFDTTRRSNKKTGAQNEDGRRQPADRAHVDYTTDSGPIRAKEIIGTKLYKETLESGGKIIQLNLWRPLCKKVKSSPLAFADPTTVESNDLVATDQRFPDRIGEIYHLAFNKRQKWYWLPNMTNTEALLLKGWDSSNYKGVIKFTPHTSFDITNQDIIKNPRDSIEARIFMIL